MCYLKVGGPLKMLKIKGSITNFKKSLKSDNLTLILRNVGN